jgi:YYY domain-containing protein
VNEHLSSSQTPEHALPEARLHDRVAVPEEALAEAPSAAERTSVQPWWRSVWAVRLALVLILLVGAYFRFLSLTDWDNGTMLHPDERFFSDVTSSVRLPANPSEYFDAARSPGNPRNVGKGFFVYGTFPVMLTRYVAVMLTPDEALPETVTPISGTPDGGEAPPRVENPERAVPKLTLLQAWLNPEGYNLTSYGQVHKVGRVVVTLFDLGSILLVFLLGSRLYNRRVGLLAALFAALAVMSIQQSHFYVDPIFSTFFTLLSLYWAVRVAQGGGAWSYALLGVSIGFAAASRVTLVVLALIAVVAAAVAALNWRAASRAQEQADEAADYGEQQQPAYASILDYLIRRSLPLLVLAGVVTILTFRILHPYAFTGSTPTSPELFDRTGEIAGPAWMHGWGFFDMRPSPRFMDNMREVQRQVSGEADYYPSQQWVNRTDYWFPWKNMVLWGMGPALGITAWLGWALAGVLLLWRLPGALRGIVPAHALAPLVLWVWVGVYFGWQGQQFASTMRYMLPIYGALIVLGAWLLVALWDWSRQHRAGQAARNRWRQRLSLLMPPPVVLRWLPVLVVLLTFAWSYAFTRIYTRPHSRVMAAEWIVQHAPEGSRIAFEDWDDPLPLQIIGWNPWDVVYQGVKTFTYAEDDPRKYFGINQEQGLLDHLEQVDYITLTSNRVYDSTSRLPMRHPITRRYYNALFSGELGFELVADVTSYPRLFGVSIPDHTAEEAFTVYDHPRVLIFKKTPLFSRARAEELITTGANWNEVYKVPVGVADQAPTALRLTESEWPLYRAGGTWSARWNPQAFVNHDVIAPLVWLLVVQVLGLAMFALLFHLLPWLPDRGWTLARALALLLVAYVAWLLGSLRLLPFSPQTVWLCALPLLLVGAWVAWRSREALRAFWHERRRALLTAEGLFLLAFFGLLLVRWLNPDLWHPSRGGEKPMDFAYLNAVMQSAAFPPYDPWFAGGYINYYYFGFVIVGALVHLTTIIPAVAYNLAVPTLFAFTALGAWGAVYNLLAPGHKVGWRHQHAGMHTPQAPPLMGDEQEGLVDASVSDQQATPAPHASTVRRGGLWARVERRAQQAALLAPLFVVLFGSLTQAIWYLNGYAAENEGRPEWAFWDATRIVDGTVNEFPFFTFLFADLHAHMIVMPFSLAVVGLLVALARLGTSGGTHRTISIGRRAAPFALLPWVILLLLGLLIGALRVTNTWDYPTFAGLTVVTLALLAWWQFRRERRLLPSSSLPSGDAGLELWLLAARRALVTLAQVALVIGVGNLLFLPFTSHFATVSSGVDFWREGLSEGTLAQIIDAPRTSLWDLLRMYGLWLFLLTSAGVLLARRFVRFPSIEGREMLLFVLGLLGGAIVIGVLSMPEESELTAPWLLVPLIAGAAWLAWNMRRRPPRALMPLLWGGTALAICLGVELFVVRGDVGRMNTVFKFGLHAWILFALASAVALPWMWHAIGQLRQGNDERGLIDIVAWAWRGAAVLLLGGALVYPLTATPARIADRYAPDLPHTLNGIRYMDFVDGNEEGVSFPLHEDKAAIRWMQQHIEGTPLILEAHQPSYRWAGRVATHTGLPTLLGWEWHQKQQRMAARTEPVLQNRQNTIRRIYNDADPLQTMVLLRLYGIEYVYVGGVERAIYSADGINKFAMLAQQGQLEQVYASGNTQIYRVVQPGPPTVLTSDLPVVPPTMDTLPPRMLEQPVGELPTVNEYAWNEQASNNSWLALLVWLVALYALGLFGLPLAMLVFGRWHDSGIVWARLIGLLLLGYAVWLPTSLGLWHYDMWGVAGGVALVLALNIALISWMGRAASEQRGLLGIFAAGLSRIGAHLKLRWRGILACEGLFLAGLLLFVAIRALNPDLWHPIWGGEKPMELGFLNAILRSPVMPPYDPFFSGGYINYYYYGLYLVSLPIKLTGIAPALAFNLAVPTIFAFTLAGGYAIVTQLTGRARYGLVGAAFLALLGNLAAVVPAGWSSGIAPILSGLSEAGLADIGLWLGDWYVRPSRVIPNTINEFPFWTFLYADLHPHMIALPLTLLVIALAYQYVLGSTSEQRAMLAVPFPLPWSPGMLIWGGLAALSLGALAVTNSWDFPTYALLLGAAIVGAAWRSQRGSRLPLRAVGQAVLLALVLAVGALALYMPFFDYFYATVSGVGFVNVLEDGTHASEYVLLYGVFLAVLLPVTFGSLWRLMQFEGRSDRRHSNRLPALLGVLLPLVLLLLALWQPVFGLLSWLVVLFVLGLGLLVYRRLFTTTWFTFLLASLAWAVSLGIEVIFIRDHLVGTEAYRMNTVFKFGLQIWTLLALAAAASLPRLLHGLGRFGTRFNVRPVIPQAVGGALLILLVAMVAVFPLFGTPSRVANRFNVAAEPTLDGLAFMRDASFSYNCANDCAPGVDQVQIDLAPDAQAIAWLNEQVSGTPVIVQSNLSFYRAYGIRVAANTGFPTVVSALHANEQHDPTRVALRNDDVEMLYSTSDMASALRLLAEYDVEYVYVGSVERAVYSIAGLQKFERMTNAEPTPSLEKVYDSQGATIYRVVSIPPMYAQPQPYPFDRIDTRPARPVVEGGRPPDMPGERDTAAPAEPEGGEVAAPIETPAEVPADLAELEEQVAADPTNAPLAYGLASRYRTINRLDDATEVLAVAAVANPQDVGLHHLWGDILAQAGRHEEAAQVYRKIAEEVPATGNWNKLAVALIERGDLEQAEEALRKAIALDDTAPEPNYRLGQVYFLQGEAGQAVLYLNRYLELAPDGHLSGEARQLLEELR